MITPRRRMRCVWVVACAIAVAACGKGADKPPPVWIERSKLDTAPLIAACGPENPPDPDRPPVSEAMARDWSKSADGGLIMCVVAFKGDLVEAVSFSVDARAEEIDQRIGASLPALLPLFPPEVAEMARRVKAEGHTGTARVGDFDVSVWFGKESNVVRGAAAFSLNITHRPTRQRDWPASK